MSKCIDVLLSKDTKHIGIGNKLILNRLGAFTLGVVITAVSVGAVSLTSAAGDKTIKACANKKTGAMRHITKGACKKTETPLSWNQMGLQGLQGSSGVAGAKGDAGLAGTNGQNLFVVDANGQTLGKYLGTLQDAYMFESNNRRWVVTPFRYGFWNYTGNVSFYSDSQCTSRLIFIPKDDVVPPDATYVEWNSISDFGPSGSVQKIFIPSNSMKKTFASFTNLFQGGTGTGCTAATVQMKSDMDSFARLVEATEVAKPTYVAPLSIVAK